MQGNQLVLSWQEASILALLIGANANQKAIAAYLDAAMCRANSRPQAVINALVALNDTELLAALNQLIPGLFGCAHLLALCQARLCQQPFELPRQRHDHRLDHP